MLVINFSEGKISCLKYVDSKTINKLFIKNCSFFLTLGMNSFQMEKPFFGPESRFIQFLNAKIKS